MGECAGGDEVKRSIMEIHGWMRRELPELDRLAWNEARGLTAMETLQMMRGIETVKSEVMRHIKYAEVLVHPFVGQKRAEGLLQNHIADQRVLEKAVGGALAAARGDAKKLLDDVERLLTQLFQLERELQKKR